MDAAASCLAMNRLPSTILGAVRAAFRSRSDLVIENIALRQQLAVLKMKKPRPKLTPLDRAFWVLLRRIWHRWSEALIIVKPETVVGWHAAGFRLYWRWKSRRRRPGRPRVDAEVRKLIRRMAAENLGWGAPHTSTASSSSLATTYPSGRFRAICRSGRPGRVHSNAG